MSIRSSSPSSRLSAGRADAAGSPQPGNLLRAYHDRYEACLSRCEGCEQALAEEEQRDVLLRRDAARNERLKLRQCGFRPKDGSYLTDREQFARRDALRSSSRLRWFARFWWTTSDRQLRSMDVRTKRS